MGDLDMFMEVLIYNVHGNISLDEIRANYSSLLTQEPYSSVYTCLSGQFNLTYIDNED